MRYSVPHEPRTTHPRYQIGPADTCRLPPADGVEAASRMNEWAKAWSQGRLSTFPCPGSIPGWSNSQKNARRYRRAHRQGRLSTRIKCNRSPRRGKHRLAMRGDDCSIDHVTQYDVLTWLDHRIQLCDPMRPQAWHCTACGLEICGLRDTARRSTRTTFQPSRQRLASLTGRDGEILPIDRPETLRRITS